MTKMKSRICAGLLAVLTLAGTSAALGVVPGIGSTDISISANAATSTKKLVNNSYISYYDMNSSSTLKGYIDGKFTLKSVTGTSSIIKSKQIRYNSKTNRTNVTITLNVTPYKTYKAYFNGTVTRNGKTSNMKFVVDHHLCWTSNETTTYGVGYSNSEPLNYYLPENVFSYPSSVISSDPTILRVTAKATNNKVTGVWHKAVKAGTVKINAKYAKAGVLKVSNVKVVNGKVYKSNRTIKKDSSWSNTASLDILEIKTSNKNVTAYLSSGRRIYSVYANTKGTSKVTVWYVNGSRSEITVTVK